MSWRTFLAETLGIGADSHWLWRLLLGLTDSLEQPELFPLTVSEDQEWLELQINRAQENLDRKLEGGAFGRTLPDHDHQPHPVRAEVTVDFHRSDGCVMVTAETALVVFPRLTLLNQCDSAIDIEFELHVPQGGSKSIVISQGRKRIPDPLYKIILDAEFADDAHLPAPLRLNPRELVPGHLWFPVNLAQLKYLESTSYQAIVNLYLMRVLGPHRRRELAIYPRFLFHLELPGRVLMRADTKAALLRARRAYREAAFAVKTLTEVPVWRDIIDAQKTFLLVLGDLLDAAEDLPNYNAIKLLVHELRIQGECELASNTAKHVFGDPVFREIMNRLEVELSTGKVAQYSAS